MSAARCLVSLKPLICVLSSTFLPRMFHVEHEDEVSGLVNTCSTWNMVAVCCRPTQTFHVEHALLAFGRC